MDAIRITKVAALLEKGRSTARVPVHLHFTPNHLLIVPDVSDAAGWGSLEGQKALPGELWIPYPTVHSIERKFPTPDGLHPIHIVCRNFLFVRVFVDVEQDALEAYGTLQKLINITSIESLFAFSYRNTSPPVSPSFANSWCPYNPEREFARMGVGTQTGEWRLSTVNQEYQLCPTYSRVIVVPTNVSDAVLTYAARFRSKGRLPTLSYIHRKGNISLTRSAQPLAGITANRSPQDERLVQSIFGTGSPSLPRDREHLIVDARPTVNALAQGVFNGAGMENTENYGKCRMEFLGIDNIHVMRDSHHRMLDALDEARHPSPPPLFGRTNWLKHLRHILSGAASLISSMHIHQLHVLVHCSDGWDRTAQLCSLAMLCLDPYYRTLEGFAVLIEKEWVATGHKFSARLGHLSKEGKVWKSDEQRSSEGLSFRQQIGQAAKSAQGFLKAAAASASASSGGDVPNRTPSPADPHQPTATAHVANRNLLHAKEVSPVFLQFLDCTYQIWRQFPTQFEFSEAYLAELATAAYSCQFGTFLFDSERERSEFRSSSGKTLQEATESVWAHLERNRERFRNPIYMPSGYPNAVPKTNPVDTNSPGPHVAEDDPDVLLPDPKDVQYWRTLLFRSDGRLMGIEQSVPPDGVRMEFADDDDLGNLKELSGSTFMSGSVYGSTISGLASDRGGLGGMGSTLSVDPGGSPEDQSSFGTTFKPPPPTFDGRSGDGAGGDGWSSAPKPSWSTAGTGGGSIFESVFSRAAAGLESVATASDTVFSRAAAGLEAAVGAMGGSASGGGGGAGHGGEAGGRGGDPLAGMDFNPWAAEERQPGGREMLSAKADTVGTEWREGSTATVSKKSPSIPALAITTGDFNTPTRTHLPSALRPAPHSPPTLRSELDLRTPGIRTPPSPPLSEVGKAPAAGVGLSLPTSAKAVVQEERKRPDGWHPLMDL